MVNRTVSWLSVAEVIGACALSVSAQDCLELVGQGPFFRPGMVIDPSFGYLMNITRS